MKFIVENINKKLPALVFDDRYPWDIPNFEMKTQSLQRYVKKRKRRVELFAQKWPELTEINETLAEAVAIASMPPETAFTPEQRAILQLCLGILTGYFYFERRTANAQNDQSLSHPPQKG